MRAHLHRVRAKIAERKKDQKEQSGQDGADKDSGEDVEEDPELAKKNKERAFSRKSTGHEKKIKLTDDDEEADKWSNGGDDQGEKKDAKQETKDDGKTDDTKTDKTAGDGDKADAQTSSATAAADTSAKDNQTTATSAT